MKSGLFIQFSTLALVSQLGNECGQERYSMYYCYRLTVAPNDDDYKDGPQLVSMIMLFPNPTISEPKI